MLSIDAESTGIICKLVDNLLIYQLILIFFLHRFFFFFDGKHSNTNFLDHNLPPFICIHSYETVP